VLELALLAIYEREKFDDIAELKKLVLKYQYEAA